MSCICNLDHDENDHDWYKEPFPCTKCACKEYKKRNLMTVCLCETDNIQESHEHIGDLCSCGCNSFCPISNGNSTHYGMESGSKICTCKHSQNKHVNSGGPCMVDRLCSSFKDDLLTKCKCDCEEMYHKEGSCPQHNCFDFKIDNLNLLECQDKAKEDLK